MNLFTSQILRIESGENIGGTDREYQDISDGLNKNLMKEIAGELARARVNTASSNLSAIDNAEALKWAVSDINESGAGTYTITIAANILTEGIRFTEGSQKTVILQGDSQRRTISNGSSGPLISISRNVTLILGNNITLDGNQKGSAVVNVSSGGNLEIRDGSVISGSAGHGVVCGGKITMSGGTISGNTAFYEDNGAGGGVYVDNGTFTMREGTISNNSSGRGGGVYSRGTFTMSGGIISGNTAKSDGGGVFAGETFTMNGGTINGNNASSSGGGVYIASPVIFSKNGGTISGNRAKKGRAVCYYWVNVELKRNRDADTSVNMYSSKSGKAGGWE